jgi:hypothetical protein
LAGQTVARIKNWIHPEQHILMMEFKNSELELEIAYVLKDGYSTSPFSISPPSPKA